MHRYLLTFLLFYCCSVSAQSVNDSIAHVLPLEIGLPHTSNTTHNTVEWPCVDESLTGKCIEYHNDQWFTFNSGTHNSLYLNVYDQQCRQLRGIQAVVIAGEACAPETYTVLACISLETQDDVHHQLSGLTPHQNYLLNIDGYLHDFCTFNVELSTKPKGRSLQQLQGISAKGSIDKAQILLEWTLAADTLQHKLLNFEIQKRVDTASRFTIVHQQEVKLDSRGFVQKSYAYTEVAPARRNIDYLITATDLAGRKWLVKSFSFSADTETAEPEKSWIRIPIGFRHKAPLRILIWDQHTGKLLRKTTLTHDKKKSPELTLSPALLKKQGVRAIMVEIIHEKTKEKQQHRFQL